MIHDMNLPTQKQIDWKLPKVITILGDLESPWRNWGQGGFGTKKSGELTWVEVAVDYLLQILTDSADSKAKRSPISTDSNRSQQILTEFKRVK